MSKPSIFISYSHVDEAHKDALRRHLDTLKTAALVDIWDDRAIEHGEQWFDEIKSALNAASVAICLISPDFLRSDFCIKEEIPHILTLAAQQQLLFLPILVEPCFWQLHPWLSATQMLPRDGKSIAKDYDGNGDDVYIQLLEFIVAKLHNNDFSPPKPPSRYTMPEHIELERLPVTGAELFGRNKQLLQLDQAWAQDQTNVISFIAWGGVGKSTLINNWVQGLKADNYRGAVRVYAWSFYSQGANEQVTSADLFIDTTLHWFGYRPAEDERLTGWQKGELLAKLIGAQKTLLLLDGMEPLQSSVSSERGKIKDPALARLLRGLAIHNPGLCVVTSRLELADLRRYQANEQVQQVGLERLTKQAGRALLRVGGVCGSDPELEQATVDFGCHALAVNLLTRYLRPINGHHISAAAAIADLDVADEHGRQPRRVIAALAKRFTGTGAGDLLKLLGLFDRPAPQAVLECLIAKPVIAGLTEHIRVDQLSEAINQLRECKLLAGASRHIQGIDCHPLVREHFEAQLQTDPSAWQAANRRLYQYYADEADDKPQELSEMEPLFMALKHGCAAGNAEQVLDEVYIKRINRGGDYYLVNKLGAFAADLSCLSHFFVADRQKPWSQPLAELSAVDQAWLLGCAAYALRALSRLDEALVPLQAGLQRAIDSEDWINSAISANNLALCYQSLGQLDKAQSSAKQSVELADNSGEAFHKEAMRATYADSLQLSGQFDLARQWFGEAEQMQQQRQPQDPYLYSLAGFKYCRLWLQRGDWQQVVERANKTITWVHHPLFIALDQLSLASAYLIAATTEPQQLPSVEAYIEQAVSGLRSAGYIDFLLLGLLTRSEFYRRRQQWSAAWADLDEVFEVAQPSGMRLHMADYHLCGCRLILAQLTSGRHSFKVMDNGRVVEWDKALMQAQLKQHFKAAKALIDECGYHFRDDEYAALKEQMLAVFIGD